ncbi:MAG: hypothetical protein HUK02_08230, partial [Bacteroidaceae bacterium]|nr:hypothetical protein [Bacteroidaceae bacterium]
QYSSIDNPTPEDFEKLYRNIDQIPQNTLHMLINNIMFDSFAGSVPSKMLSLRDEGSQEQIFYPEDIAHVTGSLLANNGVIYLTDKVYGPAKYTSVAAPANISKTNLVMKWAINNGSPGTTDYMGLNYYAYLLAMQSRFVFFIPSDEALNYYYDVVSFKSTKSRTLQFSNKNKDGSDAGFAINYKMFAYDPATGQIGTEYTLEKMTNAEICNRLKDILESHTIVLDGRDEINTDIDEYYVTKNGSAVKVTRDNGHIVKVQGGFQLENEAAGITNGDRGTLENIAEDEHAMANGTTYILDSPIIPSAHSVYSVLTDDGVGDSPDYGAFYDLCAGNEEIIKACGLVDTKTLTASQQKAAMKKFQMFTDTENGPDYNVQFFNNYRYTIFVPTNEAVDEAIADGLPTWESIEDDYNTTLKANMERQAEVETDRDNAADEESRAQFVAELEKLQAEARVDSVRLQAKITYLTNFLRYHFADNSVFVDNSDIDNAEYVTASYDVEKGLFCKVVVNRHNRVMTVTDLNNETVTIDENKHKVNILARDIACNKTPKDAKTMNAITIDGSSFAVIHQIPKVLKHDDKPIASHWATQAAARQYLKRYAIR